MEAAAYVAHNLDSKQRKNLKTAVVFEQHGVFVHFSQSDPDLDKMLGGLLTIVETNSNYFLQWCSYSKRDASLAVPEDETQILSDSSNAVVVTDEPKPIVVTESSSPEKSETVDPDWTMVLDGDNICNSLNVESKTLSVIPEKHNLDRPVFDFKMPLNELIFIKKSKNNVAWKYLVMELADGAALPPLHFHLGGSEQFLKALEIYLVMTPSSKNPYLINVSAHDQNAMMRSFDDRMFKRSPKSLPKKIVQSPVVTALHGFSKMSNLIHDIINPQEMQKRPDYERADIFDGDETEAVGSSRIRIKRGEGNNGFEVITCADLGPRFDPPRTQPINVDFWNGQKDSQGKISDVDAVKDAIFKGGVAPELRKEVWKYLLNYHPWNMTRNEIKQLKIQKEEDYFRMKQQWKSISEDQEDRFFMYKDNKSLIEKDVARTDRARSFFQGPDNPNLQMIHDILMTYVMYNFNLGYVQGMNDLLAPILEVLKKEVDAFWCFVGFMNIVHLNFEKSQSGIKRQLRDLRSLIQFLDPPFVDNLLEKEAHNFYFCFRWLLIWFKRDFSYEDILVLWEVLWTGLPCRNFPLLVSVAILDTEKSNLMLPSYGASDILKHINNLSGRIELQLTLRKALGIYNQLVTCQKDLPDVVRDVLGLKLN